jgi:hypothetical protein
VPHVDEDERLPEGTPRLTLRKEVDLYRKQIPHNVLLTEPESFPGCSVSAFDSINDVDNARIAIKRRAGNPFWTGKVKVGRITSSPGPMPSAAMAISSAAGPPQACGQKGFRRNPASLDTLQRSTLPPCRPAEARSSRGAEERTLLQWTRAVRLASGEGLEEQAKS